MKFLEALKEPEKSTQIQRKHDSTFQVRGFDITVIDTNLSVTFYVVTKVDNGIIPISKLSNDLYFLFGMYRK